MERNSKQPDYLLRFWILLLLIILGLGGLYFLPPNILGWDLEKVDLLADLRKDSTATVRAGDQPEALEAQARSTEKSIQLRDSIHRQIAAQVTASERTDSTAPAREAAPGVSATSTFVDMTRDHNGLQRFFAQLRNRAQLGRPVRIAVLGDSFIEGDIFTGGIRSRLQQRYGGSGVGWMPLTSEVAAFRQTIRHEFEGWQDHNQLRAKGHYTLAGHYYTGNAGAWVRYSVPKGAKPFAEGTIYYSATSPVTVSVVVNDGPATDVQLPASSGLRAMQLASGQINSLRMTLRDGAAGFVCYGVGLDGTQGVSVDNFSIRGNSGLILGSVDQRLNKEFLAARPYDLIILQYGLNATSPKVKDYSGYEKQMARALTSLRSTTGTADYLLLGISDRGTKSAGQIVTMPAALAMEQAQIHLAAELSMTFWSTREAMLRLGGIGKLAQKGWAAKDFTHLSHRGGEEIARQFVEAFIIEDKYYEALK